MNYWFYFVGVWAVVQLVSGVMSKHFSFGRLFWDLSLVFALSKSGFYG